MSDRNTLTPQEQPRKEISAEEFINIWRGHISTISKYSSFYVQQEDAKTTIKNIIVKEPIPISNTKLNRLILVRCNIEFIQLDSVTLSIIQFEDNSHVSHFYINNNCKIRGLIFTSESSITVLSAFSSIISSITFINAISFTVSILESSCGRFLIEKSSKARALDFIRSEIDKLYIDKSEVGVISIEDTLSQVIRLDMSRVFKLDINGLKDGSNVTTISNSYIDSFKSNINVNYNIHIKGSSVVNDLYFNESTSSNIVNYYIYDTNVNTIDISEFINKGDFILNNVNPNKKLKRYKFYSLGKKDFPTFDNNNFSYEEVDDPTSVFIKNSDLGNAQFISCNFSNFDTFYFQNSKLLNSFIADSNFPHKDKIVTGDWEGDKIYVYEQRRLALSQIKKIYEGQGDMVRSAEFRAEEMEVYRNQLSKRNKLGTWLILSLSHFTSSYGQSIWRPVFWLFCGHYLLFMWALGEEAFGRCTFQEIIYSFFYLMNPIHQYIFKNDWTILIDACMRIWSSYMVYNFIRASRRFIK